MVSGLQDLIEPTTFFKINKTNIKSEMIRNNEQQEIKTGAVLLGPGSQT